MSRILWALTPLLWVISLPVQAQDMIIRIYGDTIHCKVDREDQRFIYYRTVRTKRDEEEIISRKEVREVLYGLDLSQKKIAPPKSKRSYERFQMTFHAGYSWTLSTDNLFSEINDFYNDLRKGVFLDGRVNYYLNEELGLGFLYSRTAYSEKFDGLVELEYSPGSFLIGELGHERTANYYAVNLAYRVTKPLSNFNLQIDVGLGLLAFRDEAEFIGNYTITSVAPGMHLAGSFHLGLGEGFYLPAYLSIKGFSLSQLDFKPSSDMDPRVVDFLNFNYSNLPGGITMSRLEIGLGLGFSF